MGVEQWGLLRVGDHAPDFSARLSNGDEVRLSDFRGKRNVVLFFYPADFTPGCTNQTCSYRDNFALVDGKDAVILGISSDTMERHEQFIRTYHLPYPLISDPDGKIIRLYGASRLGGRILPTKRVTYVIDKAGVIRCVAHHEFAIRKHIEEILKTLDAIERPTRAV